jgi:hypothetical protein
MNRTGRPHEIEPTALDISVVLRARTEIGESPVWSQRTQELLGAREQLEVDRGGTGLLRPFFSSMTAPPFRRPQIALVPSAPTRCHQDHLAT